MGRKMVKEIQIGRIYKVKDHYTDDYPTYIIPTAVEEPIASSDKWILFEYLDDNKTRDGTIIITIPYSFRTSTINKHYKLDDGWQQ